MPDVPFEEQRLHLRGELQAQRQVLADQLSADRAPPGAYPRSVTMRWLTSRPELAIVLGRWLLHRRRYALALAAGLALGWRWAASIPKDPEPGSPK